MINPKDKAFYNNLSRGTITGLFSTTGGWADILLQLPRFILGVGSIGIRTLIRKRQGFLEFGDILKLAFHFTILILAIHPKFILGEMISWEDLGYPPRLYLGLIGLSIIYHYQVDFRYPKEGIEHRKEYRGRTIFSKAYIDEFQDMKLRLLDSFLVVLIGFSFMLKQELYIFGLLLFIGGICLLIEEWDYNSHIYAMKRNLEGAKHHIEMLEKIPTEKRKNKDDNSEDDVFEVISF